MAKLLIPSNENQKCALDTARNIHGDKYTYKLVKGTTPDLMGLAKNESVCASILKGYHVLLTEI